MDTKQTLISIKISKDTLIGKKILKISEKYNISNNAAFKIFIKDLMNKENVSDYDDKKEEIIEKVVEPIIKTTEIKEKIEIVDLNKKQTIIEEETESVNQNTNFINAKDLASLI